MKNNKLRHHYQSAKIYQHHYKASWNLLRLLQSILAAILHGSSAASVSRHKI